MYTIKYISGMNFSCSRHMYFDEMYTKLTKHTYEAYVHLRYTPDVNQHLNGGCDAYLAAGRRWSASLASN